VYTSAVCNMRWLFVCVQFGPLRVTLHPAAAAAVHVSSVVSTQSLTASIDSAFSMVVGTHVPNEVYTFAVFVCEGR